MKDTKINGVTCHIIINSADFPTIYWEEIENSSSSAEKVIVLCSNLKCNYVIYEVKDWNNNFSPWEFKMNKKMSFSGGGTATLEWLVNNCIPFCENEYGLTAERILCGYSLAGLFSLWAFYESQIFSGVISCSGSFWFKDWIDYARKHSAPDKSSIYLSLGDSEEKARNRILATVGDCTRKQYEFVCSDKNVSHHVLEWNEGGHFSEPEKRIAKGINWMIQKIK